MRHARAAWIASKMPPALEVAQRTITRRGIFSLFFKRRKKEGERGDLILPGHGMLLSAKWSRSRP